MSPAGPLLVVPVAKAARRRRRVTALDPLARELRLDLARNGRALEADFWRAVDKRRILDRIAARAPVSGTVEKFAGERVVFDETEDLEALFQEFARRNADVLEEAARRSYNVAGSNTAASLGADLSFKLRNPDVLQKLAERANMLAGDVADDTFEAMRETIARVFWEDRKGVDAVADALSEEFEFLTKTRAQLIAHQETLVVVEEATQESFERDGVEEKEWFAAIFSPTPPRPEHREAHGQVVPVDEPFIVGGEELMQPGDPRASLEMTMGCRCDFVARVTKPLSPEDFWDGS